MASGLWPVVLVILLTWISKAASFTVTSMDKDVTRKVSHLGIENGDTIANRQERPTSLLESIDEDGGIFLDIADQTKEYSTPKNNWSVEEEENTWNGMEQNKEHEISLLKTTTRTLEGEKLKTRSVDSTESPTLTTAPSDMPTDTLTPAPQTTVTPDIPIDTPTPATLTTASPDMPTDTPQQLLGQRSIARDTPMNTTEEDTNVESDMLINKTMNNITTNISQEYIPTNTIERGVSMSTIKDIVTAITTTAMPTNTTEEDVAPDFPPGGGGVVFARSGEAITQSPSTSTPAPTVQVALEECPIPTKKKHQMNMNGSCGLEKPKSEKRPVSESCCGSTATKCCLETNQEVHTAYKKTLSSLGGRLQTLEEQTQSIFNRLFAMDCFDLTSVKNESEPQTFYLEHGGKRSVRVFCDMKTDGGGWTVVQRRDPQFTPVDFQRGWYDYKVGFGTPETEYWVGLQNLHAWTNARRYEMRVKITNYDGKDAYAQYRRFYVDGEDQGYRLHVSGYRGTAGDALTNMNTNDTFTADGMRFTTFDRDNDQADDVNCALLWKSGGWWYNRCSWSNLNGPHWRDADGSGIGINWHTWRNKEYLRTSTIMIRPATFP